MGLPFSSSPRMQPAHTTAAAAAGRQAMPNNQRQVSTALPGSSVACGWFPASCYDNVWHVPSKLRVLCAHIANQQACERLLKGNLLQTLLH
jgi:hypothetical protein